MEKEIRVKIDENKQKAIFSNFIKSFNKHKYAAAYLGISKYNLYDYSTCKTNYIPISVLNKVVLKLNCKFPEIRQKGTLREIRRVYVNIATDKLRTKYGSNLKNVLREASKKALYKRYGENAYKIITQRGHLSSELKYGHDWRRILSKKGVKSLRDKYGEDYANIILSKGRQKLRERFGDNWQGELSKLAKESINRKYIYNFNKRPPTQRNLFKKRGQTVTERAIIEYLKNNNILFESNILRNDLEFDIVIPDSSNPKYIIEVSDIKPTTYNQRKKIIQIHNQKLAFPNAQHIAILRTSFLTKSKHYSLHKITKSFFDQENIILLSLENIDKNIVHLIDCIKNNKKVDFREDFTFESKAISNSEKGSITQSLKINQDEERLQNMLLELGSAAKGAYPMEIKEKSFVCFDNFEVYNGLKIAYEITSSKSYNSLRALAGKIILCKMFNKELRFVVILMNPNVSNNTSFDFLKRVADKVILAKDFNIEHLKEIRNNLV